MGIEWFSSDNDEEIPVCVTCSCPLKNSDINFGRCRACGSDLEDDEEDEWDHRDEQG